MEQSKAVSGLKYLMSPQDHIRVIRTGTLMRVLPKTTCAGCRPDGGAGRFLCSVRLVAPGDIGIVIFLDMLSLGTCTGVCRTQPHVTMRTAMMRSRVRDLHSIFMVALLGADVTASVTCHYILYRLPGAILLP
jgi:hypothetical protein